MPLWTHHAVRLQQPQPNAADSCNSVQRQVGAGNARAHADFGDQLAKLLADDGALNDNFLFGEDLLGPILLVLVVQVAMMASRFSVRS